MGLFSFGGMKTKVTILGESVADRPKKKIEFKKLLTGALNVVDTTQNLKEVEEIILIKKDYGQGLDLMFAKYDDPNCDCIFLGNWNDGVV